MYKRFLIGIGLGVVAFAIVFAVRNPQARSWVVNTTHGSGVPYDYSVKTEYEKPITVARVIDGDTIELVNGDRLRYIGIDTPEEFDKRKPVQCFAAEAAEENKKLVEGKAVTVYKDVSDRDKYGRWLGFVYLADGTFINAALVKNGFAFAYPYAPDNSKKQEFKDLEIEARIKNRGLWSHCTVSKLSSGREQTNAVSHP